MEEKDLVTEEPEAPPVLEESIEESNDDAILEPESTGNSSKNQNDGIVVKKSHLIIGIAVALVLVIGGFFLGYFLKNGGDTPMPDDDSIYSQVDPMKPDPNAKPYGDVQAFPENPTPGNIIMPGYSELRMHADTNLLKSVWINSEGNSCYLRFTLKLSDTGEILYQSGLIAPGMAVEESLLTRSLSRGEYRAEILMEAFTMTDAPAPLNSMKVLAVSLYVL